MCTRNCKTEALHGIKSKKLQDTGDDDNTKGREPTMDKIENHMLARQGLSPTAMPHSEQTSSDSLYAVAVAPTQEDRTTGRIHPTHLSTGRQSRTLKVKVVPRTSRSTDQRQGEGRAKRHAKRHATCDIALS
eukprot:CAMPEP_0195018316 /NCGR_PEP_ID=MMETSP0326_2-20130528/29987_1 /TAXON_ID=2866 ORGANISM="Crypthecodinium cohnii, Strain Seligo" /NCGR_SAMPLE_ID=MMETSP0326_2 /ASSEMBLY_ACC=CAM_ASM_000348 /LENGTH=131 /DNA_ID=CAMNT_0040035679 /DNA_START=96 /DNA_END=487 /DNA_ORIENTATION=+